MRISVLIGVVCSVGGVTASFYAATAHGGTIVLLAIALFIVAASYNALRGRINSRRHLEAEQHGHGPIAATPRSNTNTMSTIFTTATDMLCMATTTSTIRSRPMTNP